VCAYNGSVQGPWSAVWSFTIAGSVPAAPVLVAPANGSSANPPITFQWKAVEGATYYQVQVAKDTSFGTLIYYHGTATTNQLWTGATAGKYYWRVCAYNGSVQGLWSAVWSVTISGSVPGAPVLQSPANGSSPTAPVSFHWNAVDGATYYQVQVATESSFGTLTYAHGTTTTSQTWTGGTAGAKYYWRVCAYANDVQGLWSEVWSFTLHAPPPGGPVLQLPANGDTVSGPITFEWQAVTGATYYQVQVSTSTSFATLTYYHGSTATSQTWTGATAGKYYWRVCAYTNSVQGPWSAVWSFTVPSS
jgi:hypothetical protein